VDDLKLVKASGVVLFWNRHGKSFADGRFGQHVDLHNTSTAISLDMWADTLETIANISGVQDTTTIVHPHGFSDYAHYASQVTGMT
jgi:hypothetical protein